MTRQISDLIPPPAGPPPPPTEVSEQMLPIFLSTLYYLQKNAESWSIVPTVLAH